MKRVISVLAVVIVLAISILPAFAVPSGEPPKPGFVVTITPTDDGDVTYVPTSEVKEDGTQSFHFTATPKEGYTFDGWVIEGDYKTTDDLKKSEIDIIVSGDIKVTPKFVKKGADGGKTDVTPDKSSTSPKTGSSDVVAVSLVALSALVIASAVVVAKKSK